MINSRIEVHKLVQLNNLQLLILKIQVSHRCFEVSFQFYSRNTRKM